MADKGFILVNSDVLLPLLHDIQSLLTASEPGDREDIRGRLDTCIRQLEGDDE